MGEHSWKSNHSDTMSVVVLSGSGGNGGGGLVAARRLHGWGMRVEVFLSTMEERLGEVPAHQLGILRKMGVSINQFETDTSLPPAGLIIDSLIGYSLGGPPRGASADMIRAANSHAAPVLSLDVPSGIDASSGEVHEPSISSVATLTLALPKTGLRVQEAKARVGELYR